MLPRQSDDHLLAVVVRVEKDYREIRKGPADVFNVLVARGGRRRAGRALPVQVIIRNQQRDAVLVHPRIKAFEEVELEGQGSRLGRFVNKNTSHLDARVEHAVNLVFELLLHAGQDC